MTTPTGNAGLPLERTDAIVMRGVGAGVDGTPPIGCASLGVALTVGTGVIDGVARGAGVLGRPAGVAVADCIAGPCVGLAVGRAVGLGVADGDGGGVAGVETTMVPCIAA
jgi:hypothetical protein